jgi:hypothetical protein
MITVAFSIDSLFDGQDGRSNSFKHFEVSCLSVSGSTEHEPVSGIPTKDAFARVKRVFLISLPFSMTYLVH